MPDLFDALAPGTRVVVRYTLPAPDGRLSDALGDFLGVLTHEGPRSITVRTRRGDVVIPTESITHAKPVPPPPPRRGARRTGGNPAASGTD